MFTVKDLCARYGVTESTVLRWILSGELKALNVGRSPGKKKPRWRVTQAALDAWEAGRSSRPATTPATVRVKKYKPSADVIQFYK